MTTPTFPRPILEPLALVSLSAAAAELRASRVESAPLSLKDAQRNVSRDLAVLASRL